MVGCKLRSVPKSTVRPISKGRFCGPAARRLTFKAFLTFMHAPPPALRPFRRTAPHMVQAPIIITGSPQSLERVHTVPMMDYISPRNPGSTKAISSQCEQVAELHVVLVQQPCHMLGGID
jgi:hypothetical protein